MNRRHAEVTGTHLLSRTHKVLPNGFTGKETATADKGNDQAKTNHLLDIPSYVVV